ncbi:zinc finger protein 232-like isoform X1 [Varanus komodoensis]|uniref:zinc finger protein 232-like isoform X1 n=1 Tax=Varanus komodoensis TaxID=61221 RepID=UPI001CF774E0|nr:zinc finger protein 232-like isoform X1 [Varanus komodoensis]
MPTQAGSGTEEEPARNGEAQWRDFVKVVHPRPWEGPALPKMMRWEVSRSALVPSESPADFGSGPDVIGLLPGRSSATPEVSCGQETGDSDEASTEAPNRAGMEARRQRFRLFRYQEAEGPREAFEQLHDLCCQWLMPERCTKEQVLELLILEQFLAVLPPDMQNWVREAVPDSCYQAVALAEEFLLRQQEAEGWEGRPFETSAEAAVGFSKADQVYSERYRVVKQERGQEASVPDGKDLATEHDPARTELEVSSVDPDKPEDSAERPVKNWGNRSVADSWNDLSEITIPPLEMRKKNANAALRTSQTQKLGLHRHQRINTGPNLHICTECGQSFTRKANLFRHQQLHTGQKLHLCTICGRSFTRRENLMRHLRIHTADNGWMIQNEEGKLRAPLEGMEVAELENQDGRTRQERCEAENWRDKSLEDEEGSCFEIAIPQKVCEGLRRSTCPVCGKSFTRKATLNRHQRIVHAGENLFTCSDCGNTFIEPLLEHRTGNPETHPRKDLHQCAKCKEKNALNPSLNICESIHREKKLFKCLDCDRNFSCHSHLLRHQRIHTGEKPYLCLACGKSFRQTAHLVKHQRTHGNQARFVW